MSFRRKAALRKRYDAAELAHGRPHPRHISNKDELKFRHVKVTHDCHYKSIKDHYTSLPGKRRMPDLVGKPSYLMSYTKGLPHNYDTGLLNNPAYYSYFLRAIDSGDPRDFRDTPLGFEENVGNLHACLVPKNGWYSKKAKTGNSGEAVTVRAWESQSAGLSGDLEGPDSQSVTMPPAPELGSPELTAEMAEVYVQALLRDKPFNALSAGVDHEKCLSALCASGDDVTQIKNKVGKLNKLSWFDSAEKLNLNVPEATRRRVDLLAGNAFRGITKGDEVGPYLSQFLLVGNTGINGNDPERSPADGQISYGAISVDQKVRVAECGLDYMTDWEEWLDVQNGADLRSLEQYEGKKRRFIYTPRDLATYVHYDALYEAYLNACLIMLGMGVPFDPGIPFQEADDRDHQQGFAHFGGPHILSLVTEVATRALKAVRFQKYNVHRRCRPEVLAARLEKAETLEHMAPELGQIKKELTNILDHVNTHNKDRFGHDTILLPMAFCEGSPMHPAYGAGHATVAGACVTILKAFFDHGHHLNIVPADDIPKAALKGILPVKHHKHVHSSNFGYVSIMDGKNDIVLKPVPVLDVEGKLSHLTVEGELNKLASNISIGRDWAGVHYFTDYYESILMGEQIALGILEEQKLTFGENFSMTVPLFGGGSIRI